MWNRTISHSWNFIKSHDASQLTVLPGLRSAIGAVLPLFVGVVTGNTLPFLAMTLGAQVAGFGGRTGTLRRRTRTTLFAAFWMALTTLVGGLVGPTWWAVLVMAVLGFASGLLNAVSVEAGLVGTWSVIAFLFISSTPQTPLQAVYRGLLAMAGALFQMLIMIATDWVSRSNAESRAVAAVFSAIAQYAQNPARGADLLVAQTLLQADDSLSDSYLKPGRLDDLRLLLNAAESIRIDLVALTSMQGSLAADLPQDDSRLTAMQDARTSIAAILRQFATALRSGKSLALGVDASMSGLETHTAPLMNMGGVQDFGAAVKCISDTSSELHKAMFYLQSVRIGDTYQSPVYWLKWSPSPLARIVEVVRTNFTLHSAIFRHAIRLTVALCIATVLYHVSPIPRGYWLPLTTLVILRPEFSATLTRGVTRVLGTLLGAVFATLMIALIPDPTHMFTVLLVGVFLWAVYALFTYNMVLFAGALTAEVVVLLSFFEHVSPTDVIVYRVIYTIAGSLLAFIVYLAWPTWEHANIENVLVKLVEAERGYVRSALCTPTNQDTVRKSRKLARLARTNAANRIEQASVEPSRWLLDAQAVHGLLTSLHRLADNLLTVEYYVSDEPSLLDERPALVRFGEYVDRCLEEIEVVIRSSEDSEQTLGLAPTGALDEVSPITKEELLAVDAPIPITSALVGMEENLATMFRMVPLRR
ncbi:FUSC family protein [Alicyclobacillus sp. ALC3]|uniref:FUSC family protein n=1 Tax=Alicyclobacillus sp. ALC3 TaxID=2796143 RepID=UPI002378B355|nr:FUSC family protein [Alicyclobacillus sp. ALC3]WDL95942.1 FUSC family protein [Alicyclobacillus sp. ALC3]